MGENVEEHRHCVVCGKIVPPDEYFCSEECESELQERQTQVSRRKKIISILFFAMLVIIIIAALLTFL